MGLQTGFHGPMGSNDFLGMRFSRLGATEIVYDNGKTQQRMIWRVVSPYGDGMLSDALEVAVAAPKVIPTLFEELKKRSICIEAL